MPILSINYGISNVRGVYLSDEGDVSNYTIHYSYIKEFYGHFYSSEKFYTDVVDHFIKKMGVPKRDLAVIATGFPEVPTISYEYASSIKKDELFGHTDDYDIVSLSNSLIYAQSKFQVLNQLAQASYGEMESNYLHNLSVYKNVFPSRPSDYNLMFSNIWNVINSKRTDASEVILKERPTLFLGDVFSTPGIEGGEYERISYLHIISIIINPGIFKVMLDKSGLYTNLLHLKLYQPDLGYVYDNFKPHHLGTLINSPGDTTCLIETEIGTSQLIDLAAGKVLFVPIDAVSKARVIVKSTSLGSVEKNINGGQLGLILDTRHKDDIKKYDHNQLQIDINANLKNIEQVLARME